MLLDLEVEPDGPSHSAWSHIVRAAERRQEVVQRILIGHVHHREPRALHLYLSL